MPMIEISNEEYEHRRQGELLDRLHQATVRGDEQEQRRLESQLALPPELLMSAKRVMGSDWLRRQAFNLQPAEEAYGPDWLDR